MRPLDVDEKDEEWDSMEETGRWNHDTNTFQGSPNMQAVCSAMYLDCWANTAIHEQHLDFDNPKAKNVLKESCPDHNEWLASILKEIDGIMALALEAVPITSLSKSERERLLQSSLVLKVKRDAEGRIIKRKTRLVCDGRASKEGVHHDYTHAPGSQPTSIRMLFCIISSTTQCTAIIRSSPILPTEPIAATERIQPLYVPSSGTHIQGQQRCANRV